MACNSVAIGEATSVTSLNSRGSMRSRLLRSAFTLAEVLIAVVLMAIMAATIIPHFMDTSVDERVNGEAQP